MLTKTASLPTAQEKESGTKLCWVSFWNSVEQRFVEILLTDEYDRLQELINDVDDHLEYDSFRYEYRSAEQMAMCY